MELLTITAFARLHNVSNQAIEYAIEKGKLKPKVISGKKFLKVNAKYKPNKNMGPK